MKNEIKTNEVVENVNTSPKSLVSLSVTRLAQNVAPWNTQYLGNSTSYTIGTSGCILTSFTMIYNYWSDQGLHTYGTKDPGTMNDTLKNNTTAFTGADLNTATAADYFGFEVDWNNTYSTTNTSNVISYSSVVSAVQSAINANKPLMLGIYGSYMHFVVAYGYNGNTIYIKDPATANKTTLAQYTNNGFHVYQYRAYKKK